LGLLLVAKRRGLITAVRPILDALDTGAGFRMRRELREQVLRTAGE
jgi:predicted nucleic acid-binding protein